MLGDVSLFSASFGMLSKFLELDKELPTYLAISPFGGSSIDRVTMQIQIIS